MHNHLVHVDVYAIKYNTIAKYIMGTASFHPYSGIICMESKAHIHAELTAVGINQAEIDYFKKL
jgi:hypothetical protein